ncbi:clotting factor B-like [Neocloeon triangulifer]|uniref:clotting factor B-like n=1 Tax=Neocloeon triangulifer TaxID=2078957 RepID=UPI00286F452D|nr:clotting factor B-like [Neocloeon triangulifer]
MEVSVDLKFVLIIIALLACIQVTESVFGDYGYNHFQMRPPSLPFNPAAQPTRGGWSSGHDAEWLPPHNPHFHHHHHHHGGDSSEEVGDEDFDDSSCPGGWSGGVRWPCVPVKGCTTLRPRGFRAYCGWNAGEPLVCCPPKDKEAIHADTRPNTPNRPIPNRPYITPNRPVAPNRPNTPSCTRPSVPKPNKDKPNNAVATNPSNQKCGQLFADSEGAIVFRDNFAPAPESIIGGVPLRTAQSSPWMAAIGERTKSGIVWFCGGSLIAAQWVITAAHCISSTNRKPELVRLGELDFSRSDDAASPKDFMVANVVRHPEFDAPVYYHDVALLKLREPVSFNKFIQPVCLPPSGLRILDGAIATIAGWGDTAFGGEKSDVLLEVGVQIIPNERCTKAYSSSRLMFNYPQGITSNLLCAGDTEKGGKDACKGDSGGPLVMREGNVHTLIGVVSTGVGCGSRTYPGLYVRVSNYTEWILNVIR